MSEHPAKPRSHPKKEESFPALIWTTFDGRYHTVHVRRIDNGDEWLSGPYAKVENVRHYLSLCHAPVEAADSETPIETKLSHSCIGLLALTKVNTP